MGRHKWIALLLLCCGTACSVAACGSDNGTGQNGGDDGGAGDGNANDGIAPNDGGSDARSDAGGDGGTDGGGGDGGAGDGGGDGGEAGLPGHKGTELAAAGTACSSPNYKMYVTLGQSPGGNTNPKSTNFRLHGGVVGATQKP